jgi:hypothetical protein
VYDLEQNRELSLREYPLIVMECSVLGEKYMGLPPDEAYDYMVQLKNTCRKYIGGVLPSPGTTAASWIPKK